MGYVYKKLQNSDKKSDNLNGDIQNVEKTIFLQCQVFLI